MGIYGEFEVCCVQYMEVFGRLMGLLNERFKR